MVISVKDFKSSPIVRGVLGSEQQDSGYSYFLGSLLEYCPECDSPLTLQGISLEGGLHCTNPFCARVVATQLYTICNSYGISSIVGRFNRDALVQLVTELQLASPYDIFKLATEGTILKDVSITYEALTELRGELQTVLDYNQGISLSDYLENSTGAYENISLFYSIAYEVIGQHYISLGVFYEELDNSLNTMDFLSDMLSSTISPLLSVSGLVGYDDTGTVVYSSWLVGFYTYLLKNREFFMSGVRYFPSLT